MSLRPCDVFRAPLPSGCLQALADQGREDIPSLYDAVRAVEVPDPRPWFKFDRNRLLHLYGWARYQAAQSRFWEDLAREAEAHLSADLAAQYRRTAEDYRRNAATWGALCLARMDELERRGL